MKICIFGAGAIGGFMGARLARAEAAEIGLVARGPHLDAMRARGLTLLDSDGAATARVRAEEDPAKFGHQDYVVITLKAHSVAGMVDRIQPLLGPETCIVWAVNGLPWWYFHGIGGDREGTRLDILDPGGIQWDGLGPERMLGCVVHPAAEVAEPGVVRHIAGERFSLGEPTGEKSKRAAALSEALRSAGLRAPVRARIRDEIWMKLWGNLSFNPISALTHGTLDILCADAGTRDIVRKMMLEAREIGERLGAGFAIDVEKRIDAAAAVGAHRTSMWQDLDAGRPMEIDALVGSVRELGRLTGVATPTIDTVLALIRLRAKTAGVA